MAIIDPANPISPKVTAAGIGALLGPFLLEFASLIVSILSSGYLEVPEPWDKVLLIAASGLGAVIAAYRKTDGLRLPTLDPLEVDKLSEPDQV